MCFDKFLKYREVSNEFQKSDFDPEPGQSMVRECRPVTFLWEVGALEVDVCMRRRQTSRGVDSAYEKLGFRSLAKDVLAGVVHGNFSTFAGPLMCFHQFWQYREVSCEFQ